MFSSQKGEIPLMVSMANSNSPFQAPFGKGHKVHTTLAVLIKQIVQFAFDE